MEVTYSALYRSRAKKPLLEYAMVLEAVGVPCRVVFDAGEHVLIVHEQDAPTARAEIEAYLGENAESAPAPRLLPHFSGGGVGVYCFVAVILMVDILRSRYAFEVNWFDAGKAHVELIRDGQWWRIVTALTLHSGTPHIVANMVVGGLFGLFASQLLGSGLAWFSILIGGAAGNAVNAVFRPSGHVSIGASTAVFAALGIVAAYAWTRRRDRQVPILARWAPLIGGAVLLGFLGTGGARTDVAAHVAGFGCGVLLGIVYGSVGERLQISDGRQRAFGILAIGIAAAAWAVALHHALA